MSNLADLCGMLVKGLRRNWVETKSLDHDQLCDADVRMSEMVAHSVNSVFSDAERAQYSGASRFFENADSLGLPLERKNAFRAKASSLANTLLDGARVDEVDEPDAMAIVCVALSCHVVWTFEDLKSKSACDRVDMDRALGRWACSYLTEHASPAELEAGGEWLVVD